jgi:hypothetical protein
VLAGAAVVVYAAQFSDFGKGGTTTVRLGSVPAPAAPAAPIAVRLANALGRASLGGRFRTVDMAMVAPFAWDRLYVFSGETSDDIKRRLGFDWPGAPAIVPRGGEHESLIAFADGRRISGSAFLATAIGHLDCLTALHGYERGTRFVIRFTRKARTPYLATEHPDAAEAACLRAVGA